LITPAFAQSIGGASGGASDMLMQVAPFALIIIIMYFLIMRPQQKRQRQHAELIKNVRRGDTVVMTGGLIGKVTKVVDDSEIARPMISDVRTKGEPVKDAV
jgi:preprotein translocase subunit YajC